MSDSNHHEFEADDGELELLRDLGDLVRNKRARGEEDLPGHRPLPPARQAAMVARVFEATGGRKPEDPERDAGPEPAATDVASKLAPAANALITSTSGKVGDERSWLRHVVGYVSTAVAAAAVATAVATPRPRDDVRPDLVGPSFATWSIRGGGPTAHHQGRADPGSKQVICQGRKFALTLAVDHGATIDPERALEIVLVLVPVEGYEHQVLFQVGRDDRFVWTDDHRALTFVGTIDALVPLTVGSWTLEARVGAPGACTQSGDQPGCTRLKAVAVDIVDGEHCDGPP